MQDKSMTMPPPATGNATEEKNGTTQEKGTPTPMPDKEKMKKKSGGSG